MQTPERTVCQYTNYRKNIQRTIQRTIRAAHRAQPPLIVPKSACK